MASLVTRLRHALGFTSEHPPMSPEQEHVAERLRGIARRQRVIGEYRAAVKVAGKAQDVADEAGERVVDETERADR